MEELQHKNESGKYQCVEPHICDGQEHHGTCVKPGTIGCLV